MKNTSVTPRFLMSVSTLCQSDQLVTRDVAQ